MHHGHRFVKFYVPRVDDLLYTLYPFLWLSSLISCPIMERCITFTGSCSLPILETCPNHVSLCCAILSTNVLSWCRVLHTVSFFIQSCFVTCNNLFSLVISATRILCLSSFLRHQHSELYNTIGTTKVSYNFTLVYLKYFLKLNNTKTIKLASTAWATGCPCPSALTTARVYILASGWLIGRAQLRHLWTGDSWTVKYLTANLK